MSRATCLAMLCALHASALASPLTDPTQGRAVFTGATASSATSIEINPAALGLGITEYGNEVYIAGTAVLDHRSIDRRNLDIDSGALSDGAHVSSNLISPGGMIAYKWHPSPRIALAVGLHSSPAERFVENEALRYHTLGGQYRTNALSVASSFKISGRVYFGLSLSVHTSFLRLKFARDTALAAARDPLRGVASDCNGSPCGIENEAATERYDVNVRSDIVALDNVVGTLGFVVKIAKDIYLGFAYHTPPGLNVQNELTGTMEVTKAPRDGGDTIEGGATVYISQPASVDAELRARLPADLDLHLGMRWEHLSRFQAYDVRGYDSTFASNGIPEWQPRARGFDQSLAGWVGVEQVERSFPLVLGARIGFEDASVRDDRTSPMTIAPASGTLDVGAQYRIPRDPSSLQWILQASYGVQYFPSVDVTDSAFDPRAQLSCYDSGYDYSTAACASVRHGYAVGTAAGSYQRIQQGLRIGVRVTW